MTTSPANEHVIRRLTALRNILWSAYEGGAGSNSATVGREREVFISQVLQNVMPPIFRIGTGEVTDSNGHLSGQTDVVVEFALEPSFPLISEHSARLYVAEGVAAVLEIKSDLGKQWNEVLSTATKLAPLRRHFPAGTLSMGNPAPQVPLMVVGYRGWKTLETVQDKLNDSVHAIYVIESNICAVKSGRYEGYAVGPGALGLFIGSLITNMKAVIGIGPAKATDYLGFERMPP